MNSDKPREVKEDSVPLADSEVGRCSYRYLES